MSIRLRIGGHLRHLLVLAGTLVLVTAVVAAGQAWVLARVSFYLGDVSYKKAQNEDWSGIALLQPLFAGDVIKTAAESRLELKTGDEGLVIRIDENAELEVTTRSLQEWKGPGTKVKAKKGRLWSNVRRMAADRENLTIETPTVLAAVRGTIFRIDIPSVTTTVLRVYEGEVEVRDNPAPLDTTAGGGFQEVDAPREVAPPAEVTAQQWLEIVSANQQLIVTRGQAPERSDFDPDEDAQLDWVQWNKQRDEELNRPEPPPPDRAKRLKKKRKRD